MTHPRETLHCIGHAEALHTLQQAMQGGRMPHAWLITGARGIGKATLAYQAARYLLAGMPKAEGGLFGSKDTPPLSLPLSHPVIERIRTGGHGNLLVIEEAEEGKGIKIEEARRVGPFLHMSAAEHMPRVIIVDGVDNMTIPAANAILKLVEEPPKNVVFLLIAHQLGRVLPTIRSRCRSLKLQPLKEAEMVQVVRQAYPEAEMAEIEKIAPLAGGSPGFACEILAAGGYQVYEGLIGLLASYPELPRSRALAFTELCADKKDGVPWHMTQHMFLWVWRGLSKAMTGEGALPAITGQEVAATERFRTQANLDFMLKLWEKMQEIFPQAEHLYLDKRAVLLELLEEMMGRNNA